ncbi:MAG: hypothetical protein U0359_18965 [Byssovorax sp.]
MRARLPRPTHRLLAPALLAGLLPLLAAACGNEGKPGAAAMSSSSAPAGSASSSATGPAASASAGSSKEEIEPVYPLTRDPPHPLAEKLCAALHDLPAKRKAECCKTTPGVTFSGECVRTLSYALGHKAVTVSEAEVDQCAAAMARSLEGCDWTSPMSPGVPPACEGILHGAIAQGERCRSSLECGEGMRCRGVGPTHVGTCEKPLPTGSLCAIAVDPLASFTRQMGFEAHHPECTGTCGRRRCVEPLAVGAPCETSAECGGKNHCIAGKCSDAPAPEAGKPCLVHLCAEGARCLKGMCVTPKENGKACSDDVECKGTCRRGDGGTKGVCGSYCGD